MAILFDTEFAVNLFQQVAVDNASLVISPLSISLALSLVHIGARGNSEEQLRKALANGSDISLTNHWYSNLDKKIAPSKEFAKLDISNKLYADKKFQFLPEYLKEAKEKFGAEPENVNFGDAEGAAKIINDFVNKTTHGKITNLVNPDDIDGKTVMTIVNSLFFQAEWLSPFKDTFEADFQQNEGVKKRVTFLKNKFDYVSHLNFPNETVVNIPYEDPEYILTIVLPNKRFGLHEVVKNLTSAQVSLWLTKSRAHPLEVSIPKFEIESSFKLPKQLKKLGVVDIFDSSKADLHGIANADLYVTDVIHKAKIGITKEGTEAAASTGVVIANVTEIAYLTVPKFKVDHPFLFILQKKGHPIFMGQYY